MGGCATKPKVAKDGEQPEPEPQLLKEDIVVTKQEPLLQEEDEESGVNLKNVDQLVEDDDQGNKRRSLSLLFNKENEDEKVTTENEKPKAEETAKHETLEENEKPKAEETAKHETLEENEKPKAEETAKHETLEDKKPLEDAKSIEQKVKHESPKKEEKLHQESKIIEPAEKQESPVVVDDVEEVFSLHYPAKESVKTGIPEAAKETSEETIIIEPAKEIVVKQNQKTNAAENEDAKVSTENEKTKAKETVKQDTLEDAKIIEPTGEKLTPETKSNEAATKQEPVVDTKIIEPTVKHEFPKTEEKLSQETKINEPVTKQESAVVVVEEKPTLQNKITDSTAEVIVKTKTPETKINEPVVEQNQNAIAPEVTVTVTKTETPEAEKVSEKTQSNVLNEPIKQEKSSETNPIEDAVVSPPKKKLIEVVLPNAESPENKAVKTTSSAGEKSFVDAVVELSPKASDVGSDKASLS